LKTRAAAKPAPGDADAVVRGGAGHGGDVGAVPRLVDVAGPRPGVASLSIAARSRPANSGMGRPSSPVSMTATVASSAWGTSQAAKSPVALRPPLDGDAGGSAPGRLVGGQGGVVRDRAQAGAVLDLDARDAARAAQLPCDLARRAAGLGADGHDAELRDLLAGEARAGVRDEARGGAAHGAPARSSR
jgi:hypothetical protein